MLRSTLIPLFATLVAQAQNPPKEPEIHILKPGETLVLRNPDGTLTRVASAQETTSPALFNPAIPFKFQWGLSLGQTDDQNAKSNTLIGVRFGGIQGDFAIGGELLYGQVTQKDSSSESYQYQEYVPGYSLGKICINSYYVNRTGTRMASLDTTLSEALIGTYVSLGRFTTAFGGWNCKSETTGFGSISETKVYGGFGYRFSKHFGVMVYAREKRSLFTVTFKF